MSALSLSQELQPPDPEILELPDLDTPTRLRVLGVDPRAGFLPTTHTEKNWALVLLDYIDLYDPADRLRYPDFGHPAQTAGRLNEVFWHQRNLGKGTPGYDPEKGIDTGQRTLRSITFEFGDFLASAIDQKLALELLAEDMEDASPKVTLAEQLGFDHPGLPPFVRFFDLREFRRSGIPPPTTFDPLRPIRVEEGITDPDRNKYLSDPYTVAERSEGVLDRLEQVAGTLTLGTVRTTIVRGNINLVQAAIRDQENRARFWTERVREAQIHGAALPIARRILNNLGLPKRQTG